MSVLPPQSLTGQYVGCCWNECSVQEPGGETDVEEFCAILKGTGRRLMDRDSLHLGFGFIVAGLRIELFQEQSAPYCLLCSGLGLPTIQKRHQQTERHQHSRE